MATTFVPTYAQPSGSIAARGGVFHLDIDATSGQMRLSGSGDLGLVVGANRMVSRLVRAFLTYQGSWWADPAYGTTVEPGFSLPDDVTLAVSDVALYEKKAYQTGILSPGEQIANIKVNSVQLADDPRTILVDATITTAAGTQYNAALAL